MIGLKKHLKDKKFNKLYLFYGEEQYLKNYYIEKMKKAILPKGTELMNYEFIEVDELDEQRVINSAQTLPFMAEKRLLIIKNSGFFNTSKCQVSDQFINLINDFPETTILIFLESNIDRRNKLFKAIKKNGYPVEFVNLKDRDLTVWIQRLFGKNNKKIEAKVANHLINMVGNDMDKLQQEIDKLCAYKLDDTVITIEDIDNICIQSIEVKIFELVDSIGLKKSVRALEVYSSLLMMNEPPIRILFMITRQFRLIYQTKLLIEQGYTKDLIAKKLSVRPFIITNCMKQGRYFSLKILKKALDDSLQTDVNIKTGKMEGKLAIELLIIRYSHSSHHR